MKSKLLDTNESIPSRVSSSSTSSNFSANGSTGESFSFFALPFDSKPVTFATTSSGIIDFAKASLRALTSASLLESTALALICSPVSGSIP